LFKLCYNKKGFIYFFVKTVDTSPHTHNIILWRQKDA